MSSAAARIKFALHAASQLVGPDPGWRPQIGLAGPKVELLRVDNPETSSKHRDCIVKFVEKCLSRRPVQGMSLDPAVKAFFRDDPEGQIVRHNAVAGAALGLHPRMATVSSLRKVDDAYRDRVARSVRAGMPPPVPKSLIALLNGHRFPPGFKPKPRDTGLGWFALGRPNVSGLRVATLKPLYYLSTLMHEEDQEKLRGKHVTIPPNNRRLSPEEWESLMDLSPSEREFRLAPFVAGGSPEVALGNRVLWFTTEDEIMRVERTVAGGPRVADRLRDALGLVRERAPTCMVLITFSGEVVQDRGHYRPVFCDAGGYERFMVRSSEADPPHPTLWGQTADLAPLKDDLDAHAAGNTLREGAPGQFNGLKERVVLRLTQEDFGSHKLQFRVVGYLQTDREGTKDADERFAARLGGINEVRRCP